MVKWPAYTTLTRGSQLTNTSRLTSTSHLTSTSQLAITPAWIRKQRIVMDEKYMRCRQHYILYFSILSLGFTECDSPTTSMAHDVWTSAHRQCTHAPPRPSTKHCNYWNKIQATYILDYFNFIRVNLKCIKILTKKQSLFI